MDAAKKYTLDKYFDPAFCVIVSSPRPSASDHRPRPSFANSDICNYSLPLDPIHLLAGLQIRMSMESCIGLQCSLSLAAQAHHSLPCGCNMVNRDRSFGSLGSHKPEPSPYSTYSIEVWMTRKALWLSFGHLKIFPQRIGKLESPILRMSVPPLNIQRNYNVLKPIHCRERP